MAKDESIILPANKEEWICEEKVKVTTLKSLILKYKVKKINLIMIDTEGYDFKIIKTIPIEFIEPDVIIYEHSHFNETVKNECQDFLLKLGYKLNKTESHTIAVLI